MFGAIVLRDIPKEEVRLDLHYYPIQGGFRGFGMVPPASWHYVSVKVHTQHVGFWCYIAPMQAVVKVFDSQANAFQDADAETQARYGQLALSGAMGPALMTYPHADFGPWSGLVDKIPSENFPPTLHERGTGSGSRFDNEFNDTHHGDVAAFLAEFQYAFISWLVSVDTATPSESALERWRYLVLSAYNAGERAMKQAPELFDELGDTLLRQFAQLPDSWFASDNPLVKQSRFFIEDMNDSGRSELAQKAQALAEYLEKRCASATQPEDSTLNVTEPDTDGTVITKVRNKDDLNRIAGGQHRLRALLLFDYQIKIEEIAEIWVDAAHKRLEIHLPAVVLRFSLVPDEPYDVIMPTIEDLHTVAQMFDPALAQILTEIFQMYT